MKFAEILFQQKTGQNSDSLTYQIPEKLNLKPGFSVKVPVRNTIKSGIVRKIHSQKPPFKTRAITEANYQKPLLNKAQLELINWMAVHYYCRLSQILKLFIPKRILENKPIKVKDSTEQKIITTNHKLTEDQTLAINTIFSENKNKFLIHGITGSGKTEIYARLAQKYLKLKKQVLILVPEISLTPQTIEYFEKSIGVKAAVIHSKLSEGEKLKSWTEIWQQKTNLVIGSRSAIFSPLQDPGLIIIDEEHEHSYKQNNNPRYSVHHLLDKLAEIYPEIKIVYGSATPSIETAYKLQDSTIVISSRINSTPLPDIKIVDLRNEFKKGNHSIFSEDLKNEINRTIHQKKQVILFLNRRGSASSVVCRDCGFSIKCENCDLPMTHHTATLNTACLICHHCGIIKPPPGICPNCKGVNIKYLGIGTQRIENDLKKEFPKIRVLRADKDTTATKNGFQDIYKAFKNHEADILVGTQMIAKGLHLPKVELVGVVLADIGLNIPDFRTAERNFQLLTQVAGRAGRAKTKGKVIIQTYNPENICLEFTKNNNYGDFYQYEITQRKLLKNPPFSHLAKLLIEEKTFQKAKNKAEKLENQLWKTVRENASSKKSKKSDNTEILIYPAYLLRLRSRYRYIVLIKTTDIKQIHKLLEKLPKEYIIDPTVKIDIDPIATL